MHRVQYGWRVLVELGVECFSKDYSELPYTIVGPKTIDFFGLVFGLLEVGFSSQKDGTSRKVLGNPMA